MNTVSIACPNCHQGTITLEPRMLLLGMMFTCPVCASGLSLNNQQSAKVLQDGLDHLDQLKQQALAKPG